jgi:hypothetical protein
MHYKKFIRQWKHKLKDAQLRASVKLYLWIDLLFDMKQAIVMISQHHNGA